MIFSTIRFQIFALERCKNCKGVFFNFTQYFRYHTGFEQEVPYHSGNSRVWIHSERCKWHDKNIQLNSPYRKVFTTQLNHLANLAKWLSVRLRTKWLCIRVSLQSQGPYLLNRWIGRVARVIYVRLTIA